MTDLAEHYIRSYVDNVMHVAQQRGSKLMPHVDFQGGYEGKQVSPMKVFGTSEARVGANRNADTPILGTPRTRRWLVPTMIDWGDLVDPQDIIKFGGDPTSSLVEAGAMAVGRALDKSIILPAFFGTAKTGENGEKNTGFKPANIIPVTYDGSGGATDLPLNVEKLKRAKTILRQQEEDLDADTLNIGLPADQAEALLDDIHVISKEFATKARLDEDDLQGYLRFNFVHTETLTKDSNGDWELPVWLTRGMHVGEFTESKNEVGPRPDKTYNTQAYIQRHYGATRTQETKVVKILCKVKT